MVPSSHCYNGEEKSDIWIQPMEMQRIRRELNQTVRLAARKRLSVDTKDHCFRGVEIAIPGSQRSRKERQRKLTAAVLQEQLFQKAMGIRDPERLRRVSRQYSRKSSLLCLSKGLKDSLAVQLQKVEEMDKTVKTHDINGIIQPAQFSIYQTQSSSEGPISPAMTLFHHTSLLLAERIRAIDHTSLLLAGRIRAIDQVLAPVASTIDGMCGQQQPTKQGFTHGKRQSKAVLWPGSNFYEAVV